MKARLSIVLVACIGAGISPARAETPPAVSEKARATVENWDKGGAVSHWAYTHVSEVFPSGIIRHGGPIVDLPVEIEPKIGALPLTPPGQPPYTLDQFVNNGAVDGCIVVHQGKIVYEKYPTIRPDDLHILMSVTKAFVLTALAVLEDAGKIDLEKPVEFYLPELKGSDWAGTRLRDIADMRSGMEGSEMGDDAYRNPKHRQFQMEATLGLQARTAPELPEAARRGDLLAFLPTIKRESKAGEKWAYTSSNTAVLGEVISRVTKESLADVISELIWSKIGAEHDALLIENERGFPVAHAGMAATLRDLARFGLLFTKDQPGGQGKVVTEAMCKRIFEARGPKADEHGILPQTYQWDFVSNEGELAKGGWGGQLIYVNREKDVVVAWLGTNLTADPKMEPLPCRMIAKSF